MIYLDNAATGGFKPAAVRNAVAASLELCANPGRSGHRLSLALAENVLLCRKKLSDAFGGYGFERTVFTRSCTEALNVAILGTLRKGDHVVTTCLEHNSVLRPLEHLAREGIVSYSVAPLDGTRLSPKRIASLVRENTKMCCVTTASNVTGYAPDLAAIRALLPGRVLLVADGAQGAGHVALDMRKTGVDALALAGHKGLHAIQGAGALLFSERMDPRPILFGGTGSESFDLGMPSFYPDRLESGTLSYPAICSLSEGIDVMRAAREKHSEQLLKLTSVVYEGLKELGYETFFEPNESGIAAFRHKSVQSEEVAQILSERFDIAVRGGLHCAPLAHKALGTFPDGLVRASFSPFQTLREARALLSALRAIATSI